MLPGGREERIRHIFFYLNFYALVLIAVFVVPMTDLVDLSVAARRALWAEGGRWVWRAPHSTLPVPSVNPTSWKRGVP